VGNGAIAGFEQTPHILQCTLVFNSHQSPRVLKVLLWREGVKFQIITVIAWNSIEYKQRKVSWSNKEQLLKKVSYLSEIFTLVRNFLK